MKKAIAWLDINFEPVAMVVLFYAMTLLLTMQVILRFVFQSGFSWGEEVSRFIFVWLMYFSISYATRNHRHISVTYLVKVFDERVQKLFMIISDLLFLVFSVFVLISSSKIVQSVAKYNDRAVTIDVSLNVVYSVGIVGFALIIIRIIQGIVWKIKNFSKQMDYFENHGGIYTGADKLWIGSIRGWKKAEDIKEEAKL